MGGAYLVGALIPVVPYLFVAPAAGIIFSALATLAALFIVGAAKTAITSRRWWLSGLESMLTGLAAGLVTYIAGRLFAPH